MGLGDWLLIASAILGSIIVVIGIILWVRNHNNEGVPPIQTFITNWSVPVQGPDQTRNSCKLYSFPGTMVGTDFFPGNPTFSSDFLDLLNPSNTLPSCIDVDQLVAMQQSHTCQQNGRLSAVCQTIDGSIVGSGFKETYYTSNTCPNIKLCPGQLSLLIPNHTVGNLCLTTNGTMEPCDPTHLDQLLRITRVNPGVNPNGKKGPNNNGLIGRIFDRVNNLCLKPSTNIQTISVDQSQYPGCGSGSTSISGSTLEFGNCSPTPNPDLFAGYVWGFISSIAYCPDPLGCTSTTYSVPPQIVYLGDLDIANFPTNGNYGGLTGTNGVIKWLLDQGAKSIQYGGQSVPVLAPMTTIQFFNDIPFTASYCQAQPSIIQYTGLTGYNTNKNTPVCVNGILEENCISL